MNRETFGKVVLGVLFGLTLTAGLLLAMDTASPVARADPGQLFVKANGTGNDCTRAAPCGLQTALARATTGDTIYVAAGTYRGAGDAVVSVTLSITLYGGWNGAATGDLVRNPGTYRSLLDGEGMRRVVYIGQDIAAVVDGFVIARGNASAVATGAGYGGGIYANGADVIIANNVITNNIAGTGDSWCYGGGIFVRSGDESSLVRNNQVLSNAANAVGLGKGGGLAADYWQGTIQDNVFRDNLAAAGYNGMGGGISLSRSAAVVSGNTVRGNRAKTAGDGFGGGIYSELDGPTLTNNRIFGNTAQYGAVCIGPTHIFTMTNNVIAQNTGDGVVVKGSSSYPVVGALLHNTITGNTERGVYVGYFSTGNCSLTLTNNIIVSHTVGVFLYEPATGEPNRVTASHTLFFDNITNTVGSIVTSTAEVAGDPLFVSPADLNYHIQRYSPAVDAGIDAGVYVDMDGDIRPMRGGFDIGADELRWLRLFMPVVMDGRAGAGATATPTRTATQTRTPTATATATRTLTPSPTPTKTPTALAQADIIFHNGVVLTMETSPAQAQAVAIRNGKIMAVGDNVSILARGGPTTQVIDLGGRTLMPGFVDAHDHLYTAAAYFSRNLETVQDLALANGITTLGLAYTTPELLADLQALDVQGKIRVRSNLYLSYTDNCGVVLGDWYKDHPRTDNPGEMLRVAGVKMFLDGGSCGTPAYSFSQPGVNYGDLWATQAQVNAVVAEVNARGYQIILHALGDRGIEQGLNAIQAVLDGKPNTLRHRIEHNAVVRDDMLTRYSEIGIVGTFFGNYPCGMGAFTVPEQYRPWVWRWADLMQANPGLPFAWHTDVPSLGPLSPVKHLYSLVTAHEFDMAGATTCDDPAWLSQKTLTVQQALTAMTMGAAYALFRDDEVGSIRPDKYADLVILSNNPAAVNPETIKDIKVLMTMVGGKVEFCDGGSAALCPANR